MLEMPDNVPKGHIKKVINKSHILVQVHLRMPSEEVKRSTRQNSSALNIPTVITRFTLTMNAKESEVTNENKQEILV